MSSVSLSGAVLDLLIESEAGNSGDEIIYKNAERGKVIYVDHICVQLNCDANVANRWITLEWRDAQNNLLGRAQCPSAITANTSATCTFAKGQGNTSLATGYGAPLYDIPLHFGDRIQCEIENGVAGDSWTLRGRGRTQRVRTNV